MAQVILLGTGAALSDAQRENTYLVVRGKRSSILVDCAGSPTQRLLQARVPLDSIDQVILTHHHPDHLYGLSVFLLDLWLAGRKKPLAIYGLRETLGAARKMMNAFEWQRWKANGFFPVEFHRITEEVNKPLFSTSDFSVSTAPSKHLLPTIAVRVLSNASGGTVVYSSDTRVCRSVVELAREADILFHEATTVNRATFGHSSARQAGEQATRAGAKKLVLVHLPPNGAVKDLRAAAESKYCGPIVVGEDMMTIEF